MQKLLIAICLLGMPGILLAQSNRGSWEALDNLHAGQRIEVVETSLKQHAGTFVTVSDEAIQLREGATDKSIKKNDVMRVTSLEKSHRLRNVLIGSAIGCGAGAGIGAAVHSGQHSYIPRSSVAAVGAVIGLLGGAVVGDAVASHDTIYRVKAH